MANSHRKTWNRWYELKRTHAVGILYPIPADSDGSQVPTEKSSEKYMATFMIETLASIRSCTSAAADISVTKINPTADCYIDRKLLVCKCKIIFQRLSKEENLLKNMIQWHEIKKLELQELLDRELPGHYDNWSKTKSVLCNAAKHVKVVKVGVDQAPIYLPGSFLVVSPVRYFSKYFTTNFLEAASQWVYARPV